MHVEDDSMHLGVSQGALNEKCPDLKLACMG